MSLTLTTFASGAVIDATVLRARQASIEAYLNEGTIAADRGTGWLGANHVYRPDFYGSPNPRTTLTSGESYFRNRDADVANRVFYSWYLGNTDAWFYVPGLTIPVQIPESLIAGSVYYRLVVQASYYVYEYGGDGSGTEASRSALTGLLLDGTLAGATVRPLYSGSSMTAGAGAFRTFTYARKQHSFCTAYVGGGLIAPGVHHVGVGVKIDTPSTNDSKFVIFQQGNITARYYIR